MAGKADSEDMYRAKRRTAAAELVAKQIARGEKTVELRGQNHRKHVGGAVYTQASRRPEVNGSVLFKQRVLLDDEAFRRRTGRAPQHGRPIVALQDRINSAQIKNRSRHTTRKSSYRVVAPKKRTRVGRALLANHTNATNSRSPDNENTNISTEIRSSNIPSARIVGDRAVRKRFSDGARRVREKTTTSRKYKYARAPNLRRTPLASMASGRVVVLIVSTMLAVCVAETQEHSRFRNRKELRSTQRDVVAMIDRAKRLNDDIEHLLSAHRTTVPSDTANPTERVETDTSDPTHPNNRTSEAADESNLAAGDVAVDRTVSIESDDFE
ncbi:hypothetical protein CYMTET_4531 [Cymbomonas tetramitiformis]|uniref:Uncharacterized protein n=1 Tax=Cymbomonas tetramitiformis TaxID=36881 RepID=A0AAE0H0Z4_9CHLO|nr:hypothetical protein CYMTET_4531 [Cymbomonas tetramitiformis]